MDNHPIIWTAPEPLWKEATNRDDPERAPMVAPAILRFATDEFMQEFLDVLATDPHRLGEYRVVPETWRGVLTAQTTFAPKKLFALPFQRFAAARQRVNGLAPPNQGRKPGAASADEMLLKLYQPAHQRYYLVTSSLVCRLAGLPDRKVDAGKQEQSGFVMRRLLKPKAETNTNPASWPEHAWVEDKGARYWKTLTDAEKETLPAGEEVLPLFSVNHAQDDQRQRRMLAGLIPVGKREAYLAGVGGPENGSGAVTPLTARKALLRKEVIEPWKALITRAALMEKAATKSPGEAHPTVAEAKTVRDGSRVDLQAASYLLLLDLANFLRDHTPALWGNLENETPAPNITDVSVRNAVAALRGVKIRAAGTAGNLVSAWSSLAGAKRNLKTDLVDALKALVADPATVKKLEAADTPFNPKASPEYPPFLFPFADPQFPEEACLPAVGLSIPDPKKEETDELNFAEKNDPVSEPVQQNLDRLARLDKLAALLVRALPDAPAKAEPAVPLAAKQPADALEGWFVIRCVYSRPVCGKLHDDVVSAPTQHFQLAGFFDPDAPARPIRIGLPIDTTPAGLRKFDRNTAFMISDTLCGQMARMKAITFGDLVMSILPWPFHRDLDAPDKGPCSLGMMCSLSIPIITICALILLIIMVSLLDMIFHWMPFFITCFPLPGLKAKKS